MATEAILTPASRGPVYRACQSHGRTCFLQRHGSSAVRLRLHWLLAYLLSGGHAAQRRCRARSFTCMGRCSRCGCCCFLVQAALISAHRVKWHRSLGTVAFCLPPIMIVLGVIAALDALHRGVQIGPLDPSVSAAIPLIGHRWLHGRDLCLVEGNGAGRMRTALILLATCGLVEAAFGRFPWARLGLPPAAGAVTGLGILVLLVIVYDLVSLHRIHPLHHVGCPFTFAVGGFVGSHWNDTGMACVCRDAEPGRSGRTSRNNAAGRSRARASFRWMEGRGC